VYTPNLRIKKAATPEKTMGYGSNPLEKIWFYSKLTLGPCPRIDWQPIFPEKVRSVRLHGYIFPQGSEENNLS